MGDAFRRRSESVSFLRVFCGTGETSNMPRDDPFETFRGPQPCRPPRGERRQGTGVTFTAPKCFVELQHTLYEMELLCCLAASEWRRQRPQRALIIEAANEPDPDRLRNPTRGDCEAT